MSISGVYLAFIFQRKYDIDVTTDLQGFNWLQQFAFDVHTVYT